MERCAEEDRGGEVETLEEGGIGRKEVKGV
jgi:hypothetical protein